MDKEEDQQFREAVAAAREVEDLLHQVDGHLRYVRGFSPVGPPGFYTYSDTREALTSIRRNHKQIVQKRKELKEALELKANISMSDAVNYLAESKKEAAAVDELMKAHNYL